MDVYSGALANIEHKNSDLMNRLIFPDFPEPVVDSTPQLLLNLGDLDVPIEPVIPLIITASREFEEGEVW